MAYQSRSCFGTHSVIVTHYFNLESHYSGFQDLVEYAELSTPVTVEHFDASDRGDPQHSRYS